MEWMIEGGVILPSTAQSCSGNGSRFVEVSRFELSVTKRPHSVTIWVMIEEAKI